MLLSCHACAADGPDRPDGAEGQRWVSAHAAGSSPSGQGDALKQYEVLRKFRQLTDLWAAINGHNIVPEYVQRWRAEVKKAEVKDMQDLADLQDATLDSAHSR